MKVIDPGHEYAVDNLDDEVDPTSSQSIRFVKRQGVRYPFNVGRHPGTTSQEVLRALRARAIYVYNQIPCWETRVSISMLGWIVWLYEHRAAKRHRRKAPNVKEAISGLRCKKCAHVGCQGECRTA
jgi:hypothetical protein